MKKNIIIGTRGSDLALWQAHFVKNSLEALGYDCLLNIIKTQGDQIQHLSLDKLEGKGFFTKEIEEALLRKEIDLAVHSHKDLETEQPAGLTIAAVSHREDPSDLLLIRKECVDSTQKYNLKQGAQVGTSSSRRKAQMLHYRKDVELLDIRGNVPTRVQKLRDGHFEAILLAKAGVHRLQLDLSDLHVEVLHPEDFVPAPAQGVLAIQCREEDAEMRSILSHLHHTDVAELIHIERSVLNRMQGGCHLPLGVYARKTEDEYEVHVSMAPTWDAPNRHLTFISDNAEALITQIVAEIKPQ
ncbi:MAG: hydroxymethylbilane synthase [Flavobacteriales bacterium]